MSNTPTPTVAVIGAGLMGHGIAQVFMVGGWDVAIWDRSDEVLRAVPERIRGNLAVVGSDAAISIRLAATLEEAVSGADLIVEALPENLDLKRELIARLDELNPGAMVATNTSVLPISEIAAHSSAPERIVGTHWWNPPYLIPIVEIVPGAHTAEATVVQITRWLEELGKTPVLVAKDAPGFIGNRLQFALWREAMNIVEEGISDAATVDLVARETFGRRLPAMGPLENADFIGLELTQAIMGYVLPALSATPEPPAVLTEIISRGDTGARSGQGFLPWGDDNARAIAEQRLLTHLAGLPRTVAGYGGREPIGTAE